MTLSVHSQGGGCLSRIKPRPLPLGELPVLWARPLSDGVLGDVWFGLVCDVGFGVVFGDDLGVALGVFPGVRESSSSKLDG